MQNVEKIAPSVLDAASAPVRLQILKLVESKEALPYTEIMTALNLDPVRDAGKFVYHLKSLMEVGLISLNKQSKKYSVTELGQMMVRFARDVEEFVAVKKGRMLVRTSRFAIEEFDRDKISASLVKEAAVPLELAQGIAAEAEGRLIKLRTRYLTAPLIREFINAILIEKGFEEYRHKLTRLGMPLYDVSLLFEEAGRKSFDVNDIQQKASYSVLGEYVLLNGVSRQVADEYLSGAIHIDRLENWILKPDEVYFDARVFLKDGFLADPPPRSFQEALTLLYRVYQSSVYETAREVSFDFFNVFLAPYVHKEEEDAIQEHLTLFFKSIAAFSRSFEPRLSLGIELSPPRFLLDAESVEPSGKVGAGYHAYSEIQRLTRSVIAAVAELARSSPMLNPQFIFKARGKSPFDEKSKSISLGLHELAADYGIPNIAFFDEDEKSSVQSTGLRLMDNWAGNWEVDCLKTANLGTVFINLPRAAYEGKGKEERFFSLLETMIKTAVDAFKSKREAIEKRLLNKLLPVLSGGKKSQHFSFKNVACTLSFVGLNEAVELHAGNPIHRNDDAVSYAAKILEELGAELKNLSQELNMRLILAQSPCEEGAVRLARLDVEKYGKETVTAEHTLSNPYYNDVPLLPLSLDMPLERRLTLEGMLQSKLREGCITMIPIKKVGSLEKLVNLTKHGAEKGLRFLAYSRQLSYCRTCYMSFKEFVPVCSDCGSENVDRIDRASGVVKPLTQWSATRLKESKKWKYYTL